MNGLQKLRTDVLFERLELELNDELFESKHGRFQVRLDKTYFIENYESQVLQQSKLTQHQMVTYERMKRAEAPLMHLSAVAGSGKTFLAVQMVIETLKDTAGQILFVAPSLPLCFHFIRWLGRRGSHENISFPSLLDRVVVLTPTMNFMKLVVQGRSLVTISDKTLCNTQYDLTVVDEAHDIYRRDVLETGFLEKVKTKRWLLLSNLSQSSDLTPCFPENATEGRLTEVVRSTKRIVAGAAAFHATPDDKEGLGSLCPVGPPVKTFLFKAATADAVKGYGKYVDHTISAIRFIVHSNPSLNLHHRLALLAPDDDFCKSFEPSLALALAYGFEKRRFSFTTFQESMSILPLDLLEAEELDSEDYEEVIILDTVENAKGLEQLFVICINLDSEINYSKNDATTRANIYQALTRAQLQAVVVNQVVKGGWLEFLGFIDSQVQKFDERAALEETMAAAASEIISKASSKQNLIDSQVNRFDEHTALEETRAAAASEIISKERPKKKKQGDVTKPKVTQEVAKVTSSIWDTNDNPINLVVEPPRFYPIKAGWTGFWDVRPCGREESQPFLHFAPTLTVRPMRDAQHVGSFGPLISL